VYSEWTGCGTVYSKSINKVQFLRAHKALVGIPQEREHLADLSIEPSVTVQVIYDYDVQKFIVIVRDT
jgi:hypothetical protein